MEQVRNIVQDSFLHAKDGLDAIPFSFLLVGHCFHVIHALRNACKDRWLANYWISFFAGFGGGTASAMLLFDPKRARISIFSDDVIVLAWSLCWYIYRYVPLMRARALCESRSTSMAFQACSDVLKVRTICSRVDQGYLQYPGVHIAPVLLGTIGGCGGKMFCDLVGKIDPTSQASKGPTEFSIQTYAGRSSFLCAFLYYVFVHCTTGWDKKEVQVSLTLMFLLKDVIVGLTGNYSWDPTIHVARLFHFLTRIPMSSQPTRKTHASSTSKRRKGSGKSKNE